MTFKVDREARTRNTNKKYRRQNARIELAWLMVAIGGSLGAMARYGLTHIFAPSASGFPIPTLIANIVGSFFIGVCYIVIVDSAILTPVWRHLLMVGFLGAFTTFSTFSIEILHLLQNGQMQIALIYFLASVLLGLLAVYAGITLTEKIL